MDEAGNTKDDLSLPKGTDDAEKLAQQIQEDFDAGKELVVTVLKVRSRIKDSAGWTSGWTSLVQGQEHCICRSRWQIGRACIR